MKNKTMGLWVDHRRAVIVLNGATESEITEILSHTDRQPGRIDGVRSMEAFETAQAPADDVKDRRFQQHLNEYYDEVIASVATAETLLIFGPGEAKGELRKRLEHEKPSRDRIIHVETTDKMTNPQIAAKVREFFQI
jgi:stalled ribosome rescue protein Dom34